MSCYVCSPGGCLEEPCFNDGSYAHETEYCPQDTIHLCHRSHRCADRPPCDCAQKTPYISDVIRPGFEIAVGSEIAQIAWPYDYHDDVLTVMVEGNRTGQIIAFLADRICRATGFKRIRIRHPRRFAA